MPTIHSYSFSRILICSFLFFASTSLLIGQVLKQANGFAATILSTLESSDYDNAEKDAIYFKMNTAKIIQFVNLQNSDAIPLSLYIGGRSFELSVMNEQKSPQSKTKISDFSTAAKLNGIVVGDLNSKAFLLFSPESFRGSIIYKGKIFTISNASKNGKAIPNIFCLLERAFTKGQVPELADQLLCTNHKLSVGAQVDQLFVDHWEDFQNPLMEAWDEVDYSIYQANVVWSSAVDYSTMSINIIFRVAPYPNGDLFDTDLAEWCDMIQADWSDVRPCMIKRGVVFFTGFDFGAAGVTNPGNGFVCNGTNIQKVALINGPALAFDGSNMGFTTAHELGHFFGLPHEDDPSLWADSSFKCNRFRVFLSDMLG